MAILISSLTDLQQIGQNPAFPLSGDYELAQDIDCNGSTITPIGNAQQFTGTFNGNGHTISNFTTASPSANAGLFNSIGATGIVEKLGITNAHINVAGSPYAAGTLAGENFGIIRNCFSTAELTGYNMPQYAAGLVGLSAGGSSITNSYFAGYVGSVWTMMYMQAEGLTSSQWPEPTITNCYYNNETSGAGWSYLGTPLSTSQMKQQASYTGWDFTDIWTIEPNQYPALVAGNATPKLSGTISPHVTLNPPLGTEFTGSLAFTVTANQYFAITSLLIGGIEQLTSPQTTFSGVVVEGQQITVVTTQTQAIAISNVTQLQDIQNNLGLNYELVNDIDASSTASLNDGAGFMPIGLTPIGEQTNSFTGSLNGNGYTISGLAINRPSTLCIGMFGTLGATAELSNINIINATIVGGNYSGILAAYTHPGSIINNCHVDGNITGGLYTGIIAGVAKSNIALSSTTGSVTGSAYLGGFVGYNEGSIAQCYTTANVTGTHATLAHTGGFTSSNEAPGTITECYSTGTVTNAAGFIAGGFAASSGGLISNSYTTSNVTATSGTNIELGGFAARVFNQASSSIVNCFAANSVVSQSTNATMTSIGGFLSLGTGTETGAMTGLYWNTETSGLALPTGNQYTPLPGAAGKTTAELQQAATFTDWDFANVWGIDNGYPYLRALTTTTVPPVFEHQYVESEIASTYVIVYEWVPSPITSTIIGLSTVEYPMSNTIYHNRTLRLKVDFPAAVKLKVGFTDSTYDTLPVVVSDTPQASYDTYITIPEGFEGTQTLFLKTADIDNNPLPFQARVEFMVIQPSPIGLDSHKLLRLGKFAHGNVMQRWNKKEIETLPN